MSLVALIAALAFAGPADGAPRDGVRSIPSSPCTVQSADLIVTGNPRPPLDVDPKARVRLQGVIAGVWSPPCSAPQLTVIDDETGQRWKVEVEPWQLAGLSRSPRDTLSGWEVVVNGLRARDPACTPDCEAKATNLSASTLPVAINAKPFPPEPARWALDGSSPMLLTGVVTRVEQRDGLTIAHVTVPDSFPWQIDLGPPRVMRLSKTAPPAPGQKISIRGFRAADKGCAPECMAGARRFVVGGGQVRRMPEPPEPPSRPAAPRPPPFNPSFEIDPNAPVLLKGTVVSVEWITPHAKLHMLGADGQRWMVEGGTPNSLLRAGLTRDSLKEGAALVIRGYQSKDKRCEPECWMVGRDVTFPDTRRLIRDALPARPPPPVAPAP